MADPIVNFFKSTLVGTYSNTDTSLTIATGDGSLLPDPSTDGEFNLTIFRGLQVNQNTEFEIVRVTAISGDVLTVTRQQEGTSALTVDSEVHSILMSATKKTFDDIRTDIDNIPLPNQTVNTTSDVAFNSVDVENTFLLPIKTSLPSSGTLGEMFYYSPKESMVFFDGSHFKEIDASYLIGLGVATAQVTANGITLAVDNDFIGAQATAFANDATTTFLSGVSRSLELATATANANDGSANFLVIDVQYAMIAGGGGGGRQGGAGGGGGYFTNRSGNNSGRGTGARASLELDLNTNIPITVGGGGGTINGYAGNIGSSTTFHTFTVTGGGGGATWRSCNDPYAKDGGCGGSEPLCRSGIGGTGLSGQGFQAGNSITSRSYTCSGGGGTASASANMTNLDVGTNGGAGTASTITGSTTYYGGGGGGCNRYTSRPLGGIGGGGDGCFSGNSDRESGYAGTPNTGGGGGASMLFNVVRSNNGGSGVVILRFDSAKQISAGAGLTYTEAIDGSDRVVTFTSGSDNIQIV